MTRPTVDRWSREIVEVIRTAGRQTGQLGWLIFALRRRLDWWH